MKSFAAALAILSFLVLVPGGAQAQTLPSTQGVPEFLTNPLGFIQEKLGIRLERIIPGFTGEMAAPEQVTAGASDLWNTIKVWVQDRLGIDLSHLIRGIVDLLVWVFEFAIKLFKSILDVL